MIIFEFRFVFLPGHWAGAVFGWTDSLVPTALCGCFWDSNTLWYTVPVKSFTWLRQRAGETRARRTQTHEARREFGKVSGSDVTFKKKKGLVTEKIVNTSIWHKCDALLARNLLTFYFYSVCIATVLMLWIHSHNLLGDKFVSLISMAVGWNI